MEKIDVPLTRLTAFLREELKVQIMDLVWELPSILPKG